MISAYALCGYPSKTATAQTRNHFDVLRIDQEAPHTSNSNRSSIACGSDGRLFVCDGQRLLVFDFLGGLINTSSVSSAYAISSWDGQVFVAQPDALTVCDDNGAVKYRAAHAQCVGTPHAIAIDEGNLVILDAQNQQVHFFGHHLEFVRAWTWTFKCKTAVSVAVNAKGEVFVAAATFLFNIHVSLFLYLSVSLCFAAGLLRFAHSFVCLVCVCLFRSSTSKANCCVNSVAKALHTVNCSILLDSLLTILAICSCVSLTVIVCKCYSQTVNT